MDANNFLLDFSFHILNYMGIYMKKIHENEENGSKFIFSFIIFEQFQKLINYGLGYRGYIGTKDKKI